MSEIDYGLPFREVIDHPLSLKEALAEIVASLRREILSKLIQNLMSVLVEEENYHFDEILDCLADFAYTKPEWGTACKHLEEASQAALSIRKPPRSEDKARCKCD